MIETWELVDGDVYLGVGRSGRLFRQTITFGEDIKPVVIYHVFSTVASWNVKNAKKGEASV